MNGHYLLRGISLRARFEELDAEDSVDLCRAIIIDDSIRDGELNGALGKVRAQLRSIDGKMYSESNPDSNIELDPLNSNWGMDNAPLDMDGLVGPLE